MPASLGPAEIVVILVIALIVLGPKRLPEAGRQVGKALAEVRRWSADVKYEMKSALDVDSPSPMTSSSPPPPVTTTYQPPPVDPDAPPLDPDTLTPLVTPGNQPPAPEDTPAPSSEAPTADR